MKLNKPAKQAFSRVCQALKAAPQSAWSYTKRKPIRAFLLAGIASGTLTQFAPSLVSETLDDYMAAKGLPAIEPFYTTAHMRVLHRYNPLQVPHMGALTMRIDAPDLLKKPLSSLVSVFTVTAQSAVTVVFPSTADAYALGSENTPDKKICVIRPPKKTDLPSYIKAYTGFKTETYTFPRQNVLAEAYFMRIMAHEARHCDQFGWSVSGTHLRESDADIYALRVINHLYGEDIGEEIKSITKYIRVISAVHGGDQSHASTFAIEGKGLNPFQSIKDQTNHAALESLLEKGIEINADSFTDEHSSIDKYYHVAQALLNDPYFDNKELLEITTSFINAVNYFDQHTPDQLIKPLSAGARIKTDDLFSYTPAPIPLNAHLSFAGKTRRLDKK